MAYVGGENKPADPDDDQQCPFCTAPQRDDEDALIVHRGEVAYVILNLYPYNAGHLLVCPYRHVTDYTDLERDELLERSEEHTSELQSRGHLVCRLLLEKKKIQT